MNRIKDAADLPLSQYAGLVSDLYAIARGLPAGASPGCQDCTFPPDSVETRPGLLPLFAPFGGGPPDVNLLGAFRTSADIIRPLAMDSNGNLYKQTSPGVMSVVSSILPSNAKGQMCNAFGRAYVATSDGTHGLGMPRQYDDSYFDRVSQCGPGAAPSVADSSTSGNIVAGAHFLTVFFVTRQGYWTKYAPPVTWTAAGGKKASITNIPVGPSNVVARGLAFSAAGGADFYHIPSTMLINDNATTSVTVDFTDTDLIAGVSVDYLLNLIELGEVAGFFADSGRLWAWGERNKLYTVNNLTFDGGFNGNVPLGWTAGPAFNAGGSAEQNDVAWGFAYRITADGITVQRGTINQNLYQWMIGDPWTAALGVPVPIANLLNADWSVRAKIKRSANLTQGTLRINCYSPTYGYFGSGLAVTAAEATTDYQEFIAELMPPENSLPADAVIQLYADGVPSPSGESFLVDDIQVFPTDQPYNNGVIRVSLANSPESFNGLTGLIQPASDGEDVHAIFTIRDIDYLVCENAIFDTSDDGVNEPSSWQVDEVSNPGGAGTSSVNGVALAGNWAFIVHRSGLYVFDGRAPVKVSQEIQPTWDSANWSAAGAAWICNDFAQRRALIGLPFGAPQSSVGGYVSVTNGSSSGFVVTGQSSALYPGGAITIAGTAYTIQTVTPGTGEFTLTANYTGPSGTQPFTAPLATPTGVLAFEYRELDTAEEIVENPPPHVTMFGSRKVLPKCRKWSPWSITANCAAMIDLEDGSAKMWLGNGAGNGLIYQVTPQVSGSASMTNGSAAGQFAPGSGAGVYAGETIYLDNVAYTLEAVNQTTGAFTLTQNYAGATGTAAFVAAMPTDNGAAIVSYYRTHFFPDAIEQLQSLEQRLERNSNRWQMRELIAFAAGAGKIQFTAAAPSGATLVSFPPRTLSLPGAEIKLPAAVTSEGIQIQIETDGAAGSWFHVGKLTPYLKAAPWAPTGAGN